MGIDSREPRSFQKRTLNLSPDAQDDIEYVRSRRELSHRNAVERGVALQRAVDEIQAVGGVIWVSEPGEEDALLEDHPLFRQLVDLSMPLEYVEPVQLSEKDIESFPDNVVPLFKKP